MTVTVTVAAVAVACLEVGLVQRGARRQSLTPSWCPSRTTISRWRREGRFLTRISRQVGAEHLFYELLHLC